MTIHWTPDRPTKPGKYWLSVHPDKRPGEQRPDVVFPAITTFILYGGGQGSYREGGSMLDIADPWFDGAQWLPYVEPPDPFAEAERLITVTLTVEERQTLSSALNLVAQSVREMPWDRPEDGDRARELASKMEALNTRLCEVPQ